jgi:acyl-CoA thioester hydrolase
VRLTLDAPSAPDAYGYRHEVRVRFAETDAMGVVHHASYLPYLEEARVAFLRDSGHPYDELREEGIEFPVLEVYLRYERPAVFDELLTVALRLSWVRGAAFQIDYRLSGRDGLCAQGATLHAAVGTGGGRPLRAPAWLVALAPAP